MKKSEVSFLDIPDAPGVYRFLGARGEVLYVGKATSLRDRLKSYFVANLSEIRSPLVKKAVDDATRLVWEETDSVLEALILEATVIKKHKPLGNTQDKDDKSFNYVVITDEEFPRVLLVRGRELSRKTHSQKYAIKHIFGPFPHSTALKEGLKVIRKIFPFFDTRFAVFDSLSPAQKKTVAFNQSIGLFPELDSVRYKKTIRNIRLLFEAKKKTLLATLEREMMRLAKAKKFEEAETIKKQLFALRHIQDSTMIKEDLKRPNEHSVRIEAYDTAHLRGEATRAVMVVVVDGERQPDEYRVFTIKDAKAGDDYGALEEVLQRRMRHIEWPLPDIVVVDGGKAHVALAKKVLQKTLSDAQVVAVVKDEKHKPKEVLGSPEIIFSYERSILLANAEAHRFSIKHHRRAFRKRT
ncbi:hypothetical protein COU15_03070 [Candidatus Kaiserbacteria bacterium CG10_big_fil_rev_8_21_14_0_10_45_20]|uniref:Excinuclease ABC subunit C n=1 Tax=Candidatus Kaiserbacteria bacterium CG10_big_fil_rev_8_21_14_0_10_45_20 TaxID=1974607 RepID=A0A2H0UF58_9BACT|nr:MAG: hypothetical protein COU15_03070 [Candidatus Kaiserbacteria bacterium CG10_big_fil_rev_8_21_14_0_10_45_20]